VLRNYLKLSLRGLRRHRLYASINIVGLAIGLAGCMLAVLFIRHELSFDAYHENGDRIYRLVSYGGLGEKQWSSYVAGDPIPEMRTSDPDVESAVKIRPCGSDRILWEGDVYRDIAIKCAEPEIFEIFSFDVFRGQAETALERPNTAVITQSLSERLFGSENPIGRALPMQFYGSEASFEITALMEDVPANTHFSFDLLLSYESLRSTNLCLNCGQPMYALLAPGADAEAVGDRALHQIRDVQGREYVEDVRLEPLADIHFSEMLAERQGDERYLYILSVVAVVILLMACANYMNLATARMMQRGKEVGIRKVLGAQRGQVIRQYLLETFALALLALPLTILLLLLSIPLFNTFLETSLPMTWADLAAAGPIALGLIVAVSLLAGSYPAFFLSAFRPMSVLRGRFDRGITAAGMRKSLVVFQFLVAIALVGFTLVVLTQMRFVQRANLGFESEHVVLVRISDPELAQTPDVLKQEFLRSASVVSAAAGYGAPGQQGFHGRKFIHRPDGEDGPVISFAHPEIDDDFLDVMGIDLVAGRNIRPGPSGGPDGEALINRVTLREMDWRTPEEALGEEIAGAEIVGVVEDFHISSLHQEIEPLLMVQKWQDQAYQLMLRIRGDDIGQTFAELEQIWNHLNSDHPFEASLLQDELNALYEQERHAAQTFGLFSGVSILIACLGLFGLAALNAEQRTKEIGIRKVLGTSVRSILGLFFRDVAVLVCVAFTLAIPLAYLASQRWLDDFAYRVDVGPGVFVAAGAAALLIALASTGSHAARAAMKNPAESLRYE
jgi:putative ABC transport system permease protein